MGKVSFKYGTASQLTNAPYSEGTFYVISDNGSTDGILYADLNNKRICFGDVASLEDDVSELSSSIPTKISELIDDSDFIKQYYGTCGTAAATVQKEVTINSITELTTGLTIFVKFTYANTAADPTLKLNNFDAKYIKRYGTTAPSTSAASSWNAGGIVSLTYDGTYWYLNDWNNTTYSAMSESEMQTGTATTARNITAARLKQAIEYHAPVSSVNGQTGEVSINIPTVPTNVSDFTNDAGYLTSYTETDPVFSASTAAGITNTDISNWNNKSNTDEKLVTNAPIVDTTYYLILGSDTTDATTKYYDVNGLQYKWTSGVGSNPGGAELILGNNLSSGSNRRRGFLTIYGSGANWVQLQPPSVMSGNYGVVLPNKYGTIALTSDIPSVPTKVSDLTNDSGFISSYTETDPTVPSWAKQSSKPSYNFSEIGSTPTTISGYGITDAYTKTQVDGLVAGVLHYKGTKAAVSNLPTSGNTTGDTWHITADGSEWAWDGTTWQELGTAVDLSDYVTTDDSRLSDARTPTAHNQALSTITGADDLKAIEALSGTSGLLKKTAANTWTLDTSNYLTSYTETDPVFSASAAANISSTDISNWNSKTSNTGTVTSIGLSNATNGGLSISGSPVTGSGSITVGHSNVLSSAQTTQAVYPIKIDKNGHISAYGSAVTITDEKVKQTPLNGLNSGKGLLFSTLMGNSETTDTVYTSNKIMWNDYGSSLRIYNDSDNTKYGALTYDHLSLGNNSTNYHGRLETANITANRAYELPDKNGTVALTSDIPDVSGFSTTDEKLSVNSITSGQTYYLIMGQAPALSPNTRQWDNTGLTYYGSAGTTSSTGISRITLGNSTSMGTINNKQGMLKIYGINSYAVELKATDIGSSNKSIELPNKSGTIALTSDIPDTSSFLTSETDPVFSASAAAGITSTDISNWNAKVSDDKTWNGVSLNKTENTNTGTKYIPSTSSTASTSMSYTTTNMTGISIQGGQIPEYDANGYLYVETPDANAGFRTVVNKNYVDSKIPSQFVKDIQYNSVRKEISMTRNSTSVTIVTTATLKSDMAYDSTNNTTGFLTLADLPIYDGTVV